MADPMQLSLDQDDLPAVFIVRSPGPLEMFCLTPRCLRLVFLLLLTWTSDLLALALSCLLLWTVLCLPTAVNAVYNTHWTTSGSCMHCLTSSMLSYLWISGPPWSPWFPLGRRSLSSSGTSSYLDYLPD